MLYSSQQCILCGDCVVPGCRSTTTGFIAVLVLSAWSMQEMHVQVHPHAIHRRYVCNSGQSADNIQLSDASIADLQVAMMSLRL